MVLRCSVHLESQNETPTYKAGDTVSGFIVLSTTWSDKLYGITVRLASKIVVDWDASRVFNPYRSSHNEDVSFHSHCQIIMNRDGEQSCLSNLVSKRTIMITRGVVHRYPFLLKLPRDLPPTFSGTYGYISYKLVVFIRKPFREMYIGASKSLKIAPVLDLNDQACQFQMPVQEERRLRLGPEAGEGNLGRKVILKVNLERVAFVPDQLIRFTVGVDNRSSLSLKGVRVFLNGNTYFQMEQSWKVDRQTLLRLEGPPTAPQNRDVWTHSIPCPAVTPTGLGSGICHSIDLQYFLQFELDICEGAQLSAAFKLVVGTVPYIPRGSSMSVASFGSSSTLSRRDSIFEPERRCRAQTAPPAYDVQMRSRFMNVRPIETPPPSYEEALSMKLSRLHLVCPFQEYHPHHLPALPPSPPPLN